MTTEQLVSNFKAYQQRMLAYSHALTIMSYDFETVAPQAAGPVIGETMGVLSGEAYSLQTSKELSDMVDALIERKDELDFAILRTAMELKRDFDRMSRVPKELVVALQEETTLATHCWHKAKLESDFKSFLPHLEKIVDMNRSMALAIDPSKPAYDTLLDTYERGLTTEQCEGFFGLLRTRLTPLILETAAKRDAVRDDFLSRTCPIEAQRRLTERLADVMCLDRDRRVIGEVEHPFTTGHSNRDVRITTHYHENAVASSLYSVIHEGGHGVYEMNIGDDIQGLVTATGSSMGVHESQSRFYENIIGRSRPFTAFLLPVLRETFPNTFDDVSAEELYRAVCKAVPSLIRTEADELTYPMHVAVRFEMEKRLIGGDLAAKDAPEAWNALYKELLGIDVPDDRRGVLQDSHWAGGMLGYFPSYAIGSAYGAQMLASLEKDVDVWGAAERGDMRPVVDWFKERIYRYGNTITPAEAVYNCCKAEFDPTYFVDYLYKKYGDIYG